MVDDSNKTNGIITKAAFCDGIRDVVETDGMSWLDATIYYCGKNDIELDTVPSLIDRQLKEALEAEGMALNLIKRDEDKII